MKKESLSSGDMWICLFRGPALAALEPHWWASGFEFAAVSCTSRLAADRASNSGTPGRQIAAHCRECHRQPETSGTNLTLGERMFRRRCSEPRLPYGSRLTCFLLALSCPASVTEGNLSITMGNGMCVPNSLPMVKSFRWQSKCSNCKKCNLNTSQAEAAKSYKMVSYLNIQTRDAITVNLYAINPRPARPFP